MLLVDNDEEDVVAWLDMQSCNAETYASISTDVTFLEVELHITVCKRLPRPPYCYMLSVALCMMEDRHPGISQVRLAHVSIDK